MAEDPITLTIMLKWSDPAGFEAFGKAFEDPASPSYHKKISPTELTARFGPSWDAYNTVLAYLKRNGFAVLEGSEDRLTIRVRATRAVVERAFSVELGDYQAGDRRFHAGKTDPAVPASIAKLIRSVSGLSNMAAARPAWTPQQIATGYDAILTPANKPGGNTGGLPPGIDGTGQTIVLVELDNFRFSDVITSLNNLGLPASLANQVSIYPVDGGTAPSGCKPSDANCGETEALLDIMAVLPIAPGAKVVVAVAPGGTDIGYLIRRAVLRLLETTGGPGIISTSWSYCEPDLSDSDMDNMENLLTAYSYYGVTLFSASGDYGSTCGRPPNMHYESTNFPSDAPHAVAVGGTLLSLGDKNSYVSEMWWTNSGGFGVSTHFPRPAYQDRYTNASGRSVPDVSSDAGDGIPICQGSYGCFGETGTSMAAPMWAAFWALASQAEVLAHGGSGVVASGSYLSTLDNRTFHTPAAMLPPGNDFAHLGLGSPEVANLVAQVAGPPSIATISPLSGPMSGQTTVTLNGHSFIGVTSVRFAGTKALRYRIDSESRIVAVTPPCMPGTSCYQNQSANGALVSVETQTSNSVSGPGPGVYFDYFGGVTSVTPNSGPMLGGTVVTVTGVGLPVGYSVPLYFGDIQVSARCIIPTECTLATPEHLPGTVQVSSGEGPTQPFTFLRPSVDRIDPVFGPVEGGTDVYLYGSSFTQTMRVWFGPYPAPPGVVCGYSHDSCMVRSPQGSGMQPVIVEVNGIKSLPGPLFRYAVYPVVAGLSPRTGKATERTFVTIVGANFDPTPGATTIRFGSTPATVVFCIPTACGAWAQPGSSTVDVTVTVNGIPSVQTAADKFTYTAVVSSVSPNTGGANGGTRVNITGAGFTASSIVYFGANQALTGSCPTSTACSATSPGGAGTVYVHVDVDGQPGSTLDPGRFTYTVNAAKGWTEWHLLPPSIDSPGDALTYDTVRREALYIVPQQGTTDLVFGWGQTAQAWLPIGTGPRPSKSAFAFHEATGKAVLFGGLIDTVQDSGDGIVKVTYQTDNTTWIWDGTTWSSPSLNLSPRARYRASIAYDAARQKIVLFGGCLDYRCVNRVNDTWTWDGANWKLEGPSTSPSPRAAAAMAYDRATGNMVLFGGATASGLVADTWIWDGRNWSQATPAKAPPARLGAGLAYSPLDSGLVLYGGRTSLTPLPATVYLDDTWIWNGSTWAQAATPASPKITGAIAGMVYDAGLNAVVVIGSDAVFSWGGR